MNFMNTVPQVNGLGTSAPQLLPQQKIVVPPITIPQGFQTKPQVQAVQ